MIPDKSIFPNIPKGKMYKFVGMNNKFMQEAMKAAKELAWDTGYETSTPVGAVWVKNGKVIFREGNGSDYHIKNGCERKKLGIVGGQYELCPGCSYKVHCEAKAYEHAKKQNIDLQGSDIYMFGHFWCCEPCCKAMDEAGVKDFYLLENCWSLFDRKKKSCKNGDWEYFKSLI